MSRTKPKRLVAIDAGHGGSNIGARMGLSADVWVREREWTWVMGEILLDALSGLGYWPLRLRKTPWETLSLAERGERSAGADVVLCLHYDSLPGLQGARVYTLPGDTRALEVGQRIVDGLPEVLRSAQRRPLVAEVSAERRWLERPRNVLHPHRGSTPVLIECGAVARPEEAAYLASVDGMRELASLIAGAV